MKVAPPTFVVFRVLPVVAMVLASFPPALFAEGGEAADVDPRSAGTSVPADGDAPEENSEEEANAAGDEDALEVSFGSSLLFIEWPLLGSDADEEAPMMAVHSVTLIVEWLVRPWMSLAVFGNVPLTPIRKWMNQVLVEEHAAPVVAVGARLSPVRFRPFRKAWFEPQVGLLLGRTFGSTDGDRWFPFAVARLVLGTDDGATLYLGGGYGFSVDTMAVLYGLGHRF